jgi:deazaflavin-dependent oxidoreductase (nitroreductase family)
MLTHSEPFSGRPGRVVLDVVSHAPLPRSWTVASAHGPAEPWYRNLRQEPRALVQVRSRYHAVSAHFLSAREGEEIMMRYAPFHPRAIRRLCRRWGIPAACGTEEFRAVGRSVPFVRLTEYPVY